MMPGDWLLFWFVFAVLVFGGPLAMLWLVRGVERRRARSVCDLCAEGYPQVVEVVLDEMPPGHVAIACTTRGYGHAAPRERCEEIMFSARADMLIRASGCVPPQERAA